MVSGEFYTISNELDWTDRDAISAIEKLNKKEKEAEKKLEKEESKEGGGKATPKEMFEYAHFRCVQSGFICDRRDEGRIQNHKGMCPYCIEFREQQRLEKETRYDAIAKMRYILHQITHADSEIELCEKKIREERAAK